MKGAELPINTLIIIVIGITVLLAAIAIFFGVFNPVRGGVNLETAKSNACQMLTSLGCNVDPNTITISNFDADKDGNTVDAGTENGGNVIWTALVACSIHNPDDGVYGDNLASLCHCWYGISSEKDCKEKVCGCPTTT